MLGAVLALLALPAPAHAACDLYAQPSGDDALDGTTQARAKKTIDGPTGLLKSLNTGQTGCLFGSGTFTLTTHANLNKAGIVLTTLDPTQQPKVAGALLLTANNVTVSGLALDGTGTTDATVDIQGDDDVLLGNDIAHTARACVLVGANSDHAARARVEGNRVHGCQSYGVGLESSSAAAVVHNAISGIHPDQNDPNKVANAIQAVPDGGAPDASGGSIANNTLIGGSSGVSLGGSAAPGPANNAIAGNVIDGSDFNVTVNAPVGTGNAATGNCFAKSENTAFGGDSTGQLSASNNLFSSSSGNPAGPSYVLPAGSPCGGKGVLPSAATGPATVNGRTSATVSGTINAHQQAADWWIEYGAPGLGTATERHPATVTGLPAGISLRLEGLSPGTSYAYRVLAANPSGGTSAGETRSFTTDPDPPGTGSGSSTETAALATQTASDIDRDGVPDTGDRCPTVSGLPIDADRDGCPDDRDGDGIPDARDACPTKKAGGASRPDRNADGCVDILTGLSPPVRGVAVVTRGRRVVALLVALLEIHAPKGTSVSARCVGRGCPRRARETAKLKRASARLHKLENLRLRKGDRIEILLTSPGKLGHFYRLVPNLHAKRLTLQEGCLAPGARKLVPVACG